MFVWNIVFDFGRVACVLHLKSKRRTTNDTRHLRSVKIPLSTERTSCNHSTQDWTDDPLLPRSPALQVIREECVYISSFRTTRVCGSQEMYTRANSVRWYKCRTPKRIKLNRYFMSHWHSKSWPIDSIPELNQNDLQHFFLYMQIPLHVCLSLVQVMPYLA